MTGMHTGHNRLRGNKALWTNRFRGKEVSLDPEDITIAEILQQTGYKTGGFGKWVSVAQGRQVTPTIRDLMCGLAILISCTPTVFTRIMSGTIVKKSSYSVTSGQKGRIFP